MDFGRWKVMNEFKEDGRKYITCECSCSKKTVKTIREDYLISEKGSRDCGCIKLEQMLSEFEEVYGLKVVYSNGFKTVHSNIDCITNDGYMVRTNLRNLRRKHLPRYVEKNNPYTIWNIKNIWLPKNAPEFELLSNEYLGTNVSNLKWLFKESGEEFYASWAMFSNAKRIALNDGKAKSVRNRKSSEQIEKYVTDILDDPCYEGWFLDEGQSFSSEYYVYFNLTHVEGWRGCKNIYGLNARNNINLFDNAYQEASTHNMYLWYSKNGKDEMRSGQLFSGTVDRYVFNCKKHGEFLATWSNIYHKGTRCEKCYKEENVGESHHSWRGGITGLQNHLRSYARSWYKDSLDKFDGKCMITGNPSNTIHHLHGFDLIVREILGALDLDIRNVGDYSENELLSIRTLCLELHYKHGLGVCISDELHRLFHRLYGYGKNTPEQFEEFLCKKPWLTINEDEKETV